MTRIVKTIFVCILLMRFLLSVASVAAEPVPGEIIVKLRSGIPSQPHERVFSGSDPANVYKVFFSEGTDLQAQLSIFQSDPNVDYAHLNHFIKLCFVPDDPYLRSSGSWGEPGQDLWPLYQIKADKAWDISTGTKEVVVAVIDTGVDYHHEELSGRVIKGYDFSDRDTDPMDDDGHGTHVAGLIAAEGNNGRGVAGLAWNSRILAIKIFPHGTEADCAAAIQYAADNNARVINMSWQVVGTDDSPVLADAIEYASKKNVVMVAAAGNDGQDVSACVPANHPQVLAVAAVDAKDQLCPYSNRGGKIDVAAPGGATYNILSLKSLRSSPDYDRFQVGGAYVRLAGTSMAAPFVSGLAALILSKNPGLNKQDVEYFIRASTKDINGYGRIDAEKALVMTPAYSGTPGGPAGGTRLVQVPDEVRKIKVGAMAFDNDNNMYVVYTNQHKVVKYHLPKEGDLAAAETVRSASAYNDSPLYYPMAVAVSSAGDRVFVADTYKNRVLVYDQDLKPLSETSGFSVVTYYKYVKTHKQNWWGLNKYGHKTETFPVQVAIEGYDQPNDLAVDGNLLYVADKGKKRILKYKISGDSLEPEPFDMVLDDLLVNLSSEDRIRLEKMAEMQPDAALIRMGSEATGLWLSGGEFIGASGVLKGGFDIWAALASPIAWAYVAGGVLLSGFIEETKMDGEYHKASSARVNQIQKMLKVESNRLAELKLL